MRGLTCTQVLYILSHTPLIKMLSSMMLRGVMGSVRARDVVTR